MAEELIWLASFYSTYLPFSLFFIFSAALLYQYRKKVLAPFKNSLFPRSKSIFFVKTACLTCAFIFTILALMEPAILQENIPQEEGFSPPIALFIDTSASMAAQDKGTGSRLARAKKLALHTLKENTDASFSLYAFAEEVVQLAPLTKDHLFLERMINKIEPLETGSSGTYLKKALHFIFQQKTASTVLLFTDGEESPGDATLPFKEKGDLQLNVVLIGSTEGAVIPGMTLNGEAVVSKADKAHLKKLALETKSSFFTEETFTTFKLEGSALKENVLKIYTPYFKLPLFFALLSLGFTLVYRDTGFKIALALLFMGATPLRQESLFEANRIDEALQNNTSALEKNKIPYQIYRLTFNEALLKKAQGKNIESLVILYTIPHLEETYPELEKKIDLLKKVLSQTKEEELSSEQKKILPLLFTHIQVLEKKIPLKSSLDMADNYLKTVFKEQEKEIFTGCQKMPWQLSLPPLYKGMEMTRGALLEENVDSHNRLILKEYLKSFQVLGATDFQEEKKAQKIQEANSLQEKEDALFYQNKERKKLHSKETKW